MTSEINTKKNEIQEKNRILRRTSSLEGLKPSKELPNFEKFNDEVGKYMQKDTWQFKKEFLQKLKDLLENKSKENQENYEKAYNMKKISEYSKIQGYYEEALGALEIYEKKESTSSTRGMHWEGLQDAI